MPLYELIIISIGLAMDATAVLFCLSLSNPKTEKASIIKAASYFALFQGLMPVVGFVVGLGMRSYVESFDHWIAFILLSFVGGKMISEANEKVSDGLFSVKNLLVMGIATSIDALVIGVTFSFMEINLWQAVITIGVTTFILSFIAGIVAKKLSQFKPSILRIIGGSTIILIGIRILLDHLF